MLERVVPLGVRHGARVEPGVDHFGYAPHGAAALLAPPGVPVDVRLVGVELLRQPFPPALRPLGVRADDLAVLRLRIGLPRPARTPRVRSPRRSRSTAVCIPVTNPPPRRSR